MNQGGYRTLAMTRMTRFNDSESIISKSNAEDGGTLLPYEEWESNSDSSRFLQSSGMVDYLP